MGRELLLDWVEEAVRSLGGKARVIDVSKEIWSTHENEIRNAGDLFYTWQYDMRWAALRLRKNGILAPADKRTRAWVLSN